MIEKISNKVVDMLIKNNIITTETAPVYQYGIEISISTLITFFMVFFWGLLFNYLFEAVIYFGIFVFFRQICGGYHAKHYWSCNLLFCIVTFGVFVFCKYVSINDFEEIHYLCLIFSVITIFMYAPVENENKKLSEKHKKILSIVCRISVSIFVAVSCVIYKLNNSIIKIIDITLLVVSVSILVVGVRKGGKIDDEENYSQGCCENC